MTVNICTPELRQYLSFGRVQGGKVSHENKVSKITICKNFHQFNHLTFPSILFLTWENLEDCYLVTSALNLLFNQKKCLSNLLANWTSMFYKDDVHNEISPMVAVVVSFRPPQDHDTCPSNLGRSRDTSSYPEYLKKSPNLI